MANHKITVPMLNANEPEATLVEILAKDGQKVEVGQILMTIETTKAAADVEAEHSGFFRPIALAGTVLQVGSLLAYITDEAAEALPEVEIQVEPTPPSNVSTSMRITEPAKQLATQLGVSLEEMPADRLVTESVVRAIAGGKNVQNKPVDHTKIILYGAGGHAKAILEMIIAAGQYQVVAVLDDDPAQENRTILGYPVSGGGELLDKLRSQGIGIAANGVGGIINLAVRRKIFERILAAGFTIPAIIHPRATIEASAKVADGVQVFANAYIGTDVVLERMCMVNTGAIVSHDCEIGEMTHIAPGAMLAGGVRIGKNVLLGMGVTTAIGISIGEGCRIGNGAILLADVPAKTIIPAGKVWNNEFGGK